MKQSKKAYIQCTQGLAAAIWDLSLPDISDSIGSIDVMSSELNDLYHEGVAIGISTI